MKPEPVSVYSCCAHPCRRYGTAVEFPWELSGKGEPFWTGEAYHDECDGPAIWKPTRGFSVKLRGAPKPL